MPLYICTYCYWQLKETISLVIISKKADLFEIRKYILSTYILSSFAHSIQFVFIILYIVIINWSLICNDLARRFISKVPWKVQNSRLKLLHFLGGREGRGGLFVPHASSQFFFLMLFATIDFVRIAMVRLYISFYISPNLYLRFSNVVYPSLARSLYSSLLASHIAYLFIWRLRSQFHLASILFSLSSILLDFICVFFSITWFMRHYRLSSSNF